MDIVKQLPQEVGLVNDGDELTDSAGEKRESCSENGEDDDLHDVIGDLESLFSGALGDLAEDRIEELAGEVRLWKSHAEKHAQRVRLLEKRIAAKSANRRPLDPDLVAQLEKLGRETQRLQRENEDLKAELHEARTNNVTLNEKNEGKERKLHGAKKKARDAKETASKEEERAKNAIQERNQRVKSERGMRQKLNAIKMELAQKEKQIQALSSQLQVEQSGSIHLRDNEDGDAKTDDTVVVFSIETKIKRAHYPVVKVVTAKKQAEVREELEEWYCEWRENEISRAALGVRRA